MRSKRPRAQRSIASAGARRHRRRPAAAEQAAGTRPRRRCRTPSVLRLLRASSRPRRRRRAASASSTRASVTVAPAAARRGSFGLVARHRRERAGDSRRPGRSAASCGATAAPLQDGPADAGRAQVLGSPVRSALLVEELAHVRRDDGADVADLSWISSMVAACSGYSRSPKCAAKRERALPLPDVADDRGQYRVRGSVVCVARLERGHQASAAELWHPCVPARRPFCDRQGVAGRQAS